MSKIKDKKNINLKSKIDKKVMKKSQKYQHKEEHKKVETRMETIKIRMLVRQHVDNHFTFKEIWRKSIKPDFVIISLKMVIVL